MAPPPQVVAWVNMAYPKPQIDMEWLDACCAWIRDEYNLDTAVQTEEFIAHVETQLLQSDLRDSMMDGTGLPTNARTLKDQRISGTPILVEVIAITEIGHSAFNLQNVRQARIERADLAGLAEQEGVEDDEGPIPNYPRTMLSLEVSDGTVTLPAIEYRSLPELKLGETPLGFKIILKNVRIRSGILFLEPEGIELKGHLTGDRDIFRDEDFVRSLCRRMGKPEPPRQVQEGDDHQDPPPPAAPAIPMGQQPQPVNVVARPASVAPNPLPQEPETMDFDEDNRTLVPGPSAPPNAPTFPSTSSTLVQSRFFSSNPDPSAQTSTQTLTQQLRRVMSPVRGEPIVLEDSSMETVDDDSFSRPPPPRSNSSGNRSSYTPAPGPPAPASTKDEFDFDDDLDVAFLVEVDKVEKAAIGHSVSQPTTTASNGRSQPIAPANPTAKPAPPKAGSSKQPPAAKRPLPVSPQKASRAQTQAQPQIVHSEIITIEDDDGDKENIRSPQRPRTRRRLPVNPADVIDVSD